MIENNEKPIVTLKGNLSCLFFRHLKKMVVIPAFLLLLMGMLCPLEAHAGKGPYPELIDQITDDVVDILIKHGMPLRHGRENPWFWHASSTGNYTLLFYQADEIPQEAVLEIIQYCMNLYEKTGRSNKFRVLMYREAFKPKIRLFSDGNFFFRLTIGGNEK